MTETLQNLSPRHNPDPEPGHIPDLEPGGGVPAGSTPPESEGISDLAGHEPDTRNRFPVTGIATVVVVAAIAVTFVVVAIGLLLMVAGGG
ncbi:DUF6480 family protein [Prescottella subtropica]|uniref:DUF6480 family protein n=1 Tax=Prescottella subtropica TaxID=2545757 RepID=UPI0010F7EBC9|nr:DUF6480 family protein [Prescottella subtropica]